MIIDKNTKRPANGLDDLRNKLIDMERELDAFGEEVLKIRYVYHSKNQITNDLIDLMHDRLCVLEKEKDDNENNNNNSR